MRLRSLKNPARPSRNGTQAETRANCRSWASTALRSGTGHRQRKLNITFDCLPAIRGAAFRSAVRSQRVGTFCTLFRKKISVKVMVHIGPLPYCKN